MNLQSNQINTPGGFVLDSIIHGSLFARSTQDSIVEENNLPNIDEEVQELEFHLIEKAFHDMMNEHIKDEEQARQMCSHLMVSRFVSSRVNTGEDDPLSDLSYIR